MLGAQPGEELRRVWDVALENFLQPGQGRGRVVQSETREGGGVTRCPTSSPTALRVGDESALHPLVYIQ